MTTTRSHGTAGNGATLGHASDMLRVRIADGQREAAERTRWASSSVFSERKKLPVKTNRHALAAR